jgi:serine/threonine protein kinase/Flp pilus assembly protein TadD
VNPNDNSNSKKPAVLPGASAPSLQVREDPRVVGALEEYLVALEAGAAPDRSTFLARHPDIADALANCLEGLEFIRAAAPQVREPAVDGVTNTPAGCTFHPEAPLGDFRIVREVGRGGMGVVYEAVQLSLGRRVALKVLPFAAALDAKQLERFKNEAQAAAQLHHTNIVPVFGVGCERGLHFYAMQYIEGQTLAGVIRQLRQEAGIEDRGSKIENRGSQLRKQDTTFRVQGPRDETKPAAPPSSILDPRSPFFHTVAHLGIQAAEALEHAHQLGVIHRDIKPANLLVDVRRNLWVTDFGLAQFHGDAGLTRTGDLLGTLRYMSPEQARAKHALVDHRTDIYSLGATLYELLTLEPAFAGHDRHELLLHIAFEEPRPPRRLNKALPVELETIVLKSMEKDPAERYATAQELADDLRRFLEDRPIRAKRPTLVQRARKWTRRHRALVGAGVAVMFITMVAAVLCSLLIWHEKERVEEQKERAEKAGAAEAEQRRRAEKAAAAEAEHRRLAEARLQYVREAEEINAQIARMLANVPHMDKEERAIMERVLGFYRNLIEKQGHDPLVRMETARAYRRMAGIQEKLGRHGEADKANREAIALLEPLAAKSPPGSVYHFELATALNNRGGLLLNTGRPRQAEQALRRSLAIYKTLDDQLAKGLSKELLEALRVAGAPREQPDARRTPAARHAQRVNACAKIIRYDLATNHSNLGLLLTATNRPEEAEKAYQDARPLLEKLVADNEAEAIYRYALACVHKNQGQLLLAGGRLAKAEEAFARALDLLQKLAADSPTRPTYRQALGATHSGLAVVLARTGRVAQACDGFRTALKIHKKLVDDFPSWPNYQFGLAMALNDFGIVLQAAGQFGAAEVAFRRAETYLQKLADNHPAVPEYRQQLARSRFNQGAFLEAIGRPRDAEKPLRQAQEIFEKLGPGSATEVRPDLAGTLNSLALALNATGRAQEAEATYRKAIALWENLTDDFPKMADYHSNLGGTLANLGMLLNSQKQWAKARRLVECAIRCQQAALQHNPSHPGYRRSLQNHYRILADTLKGLGLHEEAAQATEAAARIGRNE